MAKTGPAEPRQCTVCGDNNVRLCARCKSAWYCTMICQQDDWCTHRLLCGDFSKFDYSSRPSQEHVLAILFPDDEPKPKLVWLQCKWHGDEDSLVGKYQKPMSDAFLGADSFAMYTPLIYNPLLNMPMPNTVKLCFRYEDVFGSSDAGVNQSITAVAATKPGSYHTAKGPRLAIGMVGPGTEAESYKDINMTDFRHVTDYFLSHSCDPVSKSTEAKIKGVRINCLGDIKMFGKPCFEAVEVGEDDPIFRQHDTSDIAARVELPIFTRRCGTDEKWASDTNNEMFRGSGPFENQDATFLHLSCEIKKKPHSRIGKLGWGWASKQWQSNVGSTLVVRQDKKPLHPWHIEALCQYCRSEICPLMAHCNGECWPEKPMEKTAVLNMISRATFVVHWYKMVLERKSEGEESVPFPYDDVPAEGQSLTL